MQFKPKSEKELKEQMLWPAGEYPFEIAKAEPAKSGPQSKNPGTPYIKLLVRIFSETGTERVVNSMLHPNMEWQLRSFCYETGMDDLYLNGTLEAQDCEGKAGILQLKIKEADGNFPAKNEVKDWGKKEVKGKKEVAKAAPAAPYDPEAEIPF